MAQISMDQMSWVRLCVNSEVMDVIKTNPLNHDQKISVIDGENFVDFSMNITPDLMDWIQCMGAHVEVIYPIELRELIRSNLVETLWKYRLA